MKTKRQLRPIEIAMLVVPLGALAFASWRVRNTPEPIVPPRYSIRVLDTRLSIRGLNDSGDLFGLFSKGADGMELFAIRKGQIQKLGLRDNCAPVAMNNAGEIAGNCSTNGETRAFVWRNKRIVHLKTLGGANSYAVDINDKGEVVGRAETKLVNKSKQVVEHAFLWRNGQMQNLTSKSENRSAALSIDNAGIIILSEPDGLAVWHHGTKIWVGDKENFSRYYNGTFLDTLNTVSALWHKGQRVDLKPIPNIDGWYADDVNDHGVAVGGGNTTKVSQFACIFIRGQMFDLNILLSSDSNWTLQVANDINNKGQIVGEGTLNGKRRFFLLTPQNPATSSTRTDE